MAEIIFPVDPVEGDWFTFGTKTWVWNGYAWDFNGLAVLVPGEPTYGTHVFSHGPIDPLDATEYFFGDIPDDFPITSNLPQGKLICLHEGNVEDITVMIHPGAFSTDEESTYSLINDTSSEEIYSFKAKHSTDTLSIYTLPAPVKIAKGDLLYIQWNTPTWITNPSSVRCRIEIKIKLPLYA